MELHCNQQLYLFSLLYLVKNIQFFSCFWVYQEDGVKDNLVELLPNFPCISLWTSVKLFSTILEAKCNARNAMKPSQHLQTSG